MGKRYEQYTPAFKLRVVSEYRAGERGAGLSALAKKWRVGGGAMLVRRWVEQYDGTIKSLAKRTRPNRRRILSQQQAEEHIRDLVADRHAEKKAVSYREVAEDVRELTGASISDRTVRRYGHNLFHQRERRVQSKAPREGTTCSLDHDRLKHSGVFVVDDDWTSEVISFRKKAKRFGAKNLVFMDQSAVRMGDPPSRSIVPPGCAAVVIAPTNALFPDRIDIMGACAIDRTLALQIMTPAQRKQRGIKGWRKVQVLDFIRKRLAPSMNQLEGERFALCMDKALSIKSQEALETLRAGGCRRAQFAWHIPTGAAKHVSPLDNSLWHEYKQRVRQHRAPDIDTLCRVLRAEWKKQSSENLHAYYRHCGLTRAADPHKDLD